MADETRDSQEPLRSPVEAEVDIDRPTFVPPVDIYETDEGAVLVADLPGCGESDIGISLEDGVLTLRGRVEPEEPEGLKLTAAEYRVGDFERSFTVSELVDPEKVEATFRDGVVRLTLPKAEAAKPTKIEVKLG